MTRDEYRKPTAKELLFRERQWELVARRYNELLPLPAELKDVPGAYEARYGPQAVIEVRSRLLTELTDLSVKGQIVWGMSGSKAPLQLTVLAREFERYEGGGCEAQLYRWRIGCTIWETENVPGAGPWILAQLGATWDGHEKDMLLLASLTHCAPEDAVAAARRWFHSHPDSAADVICKVGTAVDVEFLEENAAQAIASRTSYPENRPTLRKRADQLRRRLLRDSERAASRAQKIRLQAEKRAKMKQGQ